MQIHTERPRTAQITNLQILEWQWLWREKKALNVRSTNHFNPSIPIHITIINCIKVGQRNVDGTFLVDGSSFKLRIPACRKWMQKLKWHDFELCLRLKKLHVFIGWSISSAYNKCYVHVTWKLWQLVLICVLHGDAWVWKHYKLYLLHKNCTMSCFTIAVLTFNCKHGLWNHHYIIWCFLSLLNENGMLREVDCNSYFGNNLQWLL